MAKSTLLTINSWKKDLLSIALTFFAVKIANTVHPMGNCEKLTLPIPFCIPKHFFNIWWVFRVNLFIDLNFNISKRVYDIVFYWIVHLKKNILYLKRCGYVFIILVADKTYIINLLGLLIPSWIRFYIYIYIHVIQNWILGHF